MINTILRKYYIPLIKLSRLLLLLALGLNEICRAACPTTASTNLIFSHLGCNSIQLTWTKGNGTNRIVVAYPTSTITLPNAGTTYTGNYAYTSGTAVGTGYTVYTGTGNSVTILGLTASKQYWFAIYEYNTTACYLASATFTKTTSACTNCPSITGIMVNSCDDGCSSDPDNTGTANGNCCEGNSEFIILSTGSYGWDNGVVQPSIDYEVTQGTVFVSATTYAAETSPMTTLNNSSDCANGSFIDASAGGVAIPAWTNVMIGFSNYPSDDFCPNNYTFTSLCAAMSPIYCLFATDNNIRYNGNFDNYSSTSSLRYFYADFSGISASCAEQYYDYDVSLQGNGNGASISYNSISTSLAHPETPTYNPLSCGPSAIILPIKLLNFSALYNIHNNAVQIDWATASELNNLQFTVQRSQDGYKWENIAHVEGAGNSNTNKYYQALDESPYQGVSYYKLEQTDFDGNVTFSNVASVNITSLPKEIEINPNPANTSATISLNLPNTESIILNIYDINGKEIETKEFSPEKDSKAYLLNTTKYLNGVYFLITNIGGQQYSTKLVVNHY